MVDKKLSSKKEVKKPNTDKGQKAKGQCAPQSKPSKGCSCCS